MGKNIKYAISINYKYFVNKLGLGKKMKHEHGRKQTVICCFWL